MELKIKLLYPDSRLPERKTAGAAAWDVYAHSVRVRLPLYDSKVGGIISGLLEVGLGFAAEIPAGFRAMLMARSGIAEMPMSLTNGLGLIDSDYRGEWRMIFRMHEPPPVTEIQDGVRHHAYNKDILYRVGDRVGQFYLAPVVDFSLNVVDQLSETERGAGGFGSTGR